MKRWVVGPAAHRLSMAPGAKAQFKPSNREENANGSLSIEPVGSPGQLAGASLGRANGSTDPAKSRGRRRATAGVRLASRRGRHRVGTTGEEIVLDQLLQHIVNTLIMGGTYALLGIGLTLIFGIMRIVNFTHGELYAFGAYMMYFFAAVIGMNFFVSIAFAIAAGMILGAFIEYTLLRSKRGADIDTTMLIMIGAWIVFQNLEHLVWGGVAKSIPSPLPEQPLVLGPVSLSWLRVMVLVIALALIAATYVVINRTKLGKAMRATFQDSNTAALMGINVNAIHTMTFGLGSALAAAAGALLGPVFVVTPTMGDLASLKAFAIVILGGLGNITGAAIGGFILAFAEEIGAGYISSGYRDAMGFVIIIIVLLFKPTGLFARTERVG